MPRSSMWSVSYKFPYQHPARIARNILCVHVTQLLCAHDTTFTRKYEHLALTHNGKQTNTLYSRAPTTCSSLAGWQDTTEHTWLPNADCCYKLQLTEIHDVTAPWDAGQFLGAGKLRHGFQCSQQTLVMVKCLTTVSVTNMWYGGMDWIELVTDWWRAPVNAVMNLGGSIKCGGFLGWELLSFSTRTFLHGVSKLLIL
jgi:hypothetical protein